MLARHGRAIARVREEAKRVIGEVAEGSFNRATERFDDILLRADVGVIDVAWARQAEPAIEIQRQASERRRALEVLDDRLERVLRGQGNDSGGRAP